MPLRSNHEAIIVIVAGLSVVVTVTVTVTVAWPFPTATFSFTCTPVGANVIVAPSVLDVDVLALLPSAAWGLSGSACGDIAEDILFGVCDTGEVGTELCLLLSLVGVGSL